MLQQMFEVTAKIRSSSLKPMFIDYMKASSGISGNTAHIYTGGTRTVGAHRIK